MAGYVVSLLGEGTRYGYVAELLFYAGPVIITKPANFICICLPVRNAFAGQLSSSGYVPTAEHLETLSPNMFMAQMSIRFLFMPSISHYDIEGSRFHLRFMPADIMKERERAFENYES